MYAIRSYYALDGRHVLLLGAVARVLGEQLHRLPAADELAAALVESYNFV